MGTIIEDCPVFNNNDISYIKGSSIGSDISYFKGSSVDFGIIHQKDEQITENPQKAFIIQKDELGFYLKTFVISCQAIEKIEFPNKNRVLDYLRNFKDKLDRHDDSKNVNLNHYYELDSEEIDNRINKDPVIPVESLKVDNTVVEDLTKNYLEDVYFEGEKHPVIIPIVEKSMHCKKCDAVYSTKKALKKHNEKCHSVKSEKNRDVENGIKLSGKSKYPCDICSAVFGYKKSFHKHMKQCHSVELPPLPKEYWKKTIPFKSLVCAFCDKAFSAKDRYNKHLSDVHGKNVHGEDIHVPKKQSMEKCPFCELKFIKSKSSYKLVRHLQLDHHDEDLDNVIKELQLGEEGRVMCQICGESKTNKYVLANHIRVVHEGNGSHSTDVYPCKYCVKVFKYKTDANNHMESHEPCQQIECKECGTKFPGMSLLKKHMRNVHLQLDDMCDICDKMITKSKMNRHIKTVHLQKQFACEFCRYKFAKEHLLKDHARKIHGRDTNMVS